MAVGAVGGEGGEATVTALLFRSGTLKVHIGQVYLKRPTAS